MRRADPAAFATAEAAEQYGRASAPKSRIALIEASYKSALRVFGADPIGRAKTPAEALFERLISPPEPFLATLKLKTGKVGEVYRQQIATVGGVAPKQWTILRGKLPAGVNFGKRIGLFLGIPKKAGNYKLALQVVDALGAKSSKNITIKVK